MSTIELNQVIRTLEIKKVYGMGDVQVNALDGITFDVFAGEFVAIMGPSGSGKSTLMNILGCLDRPTSGQYYLNEKDVSGMGKTELAHIRNHQLGFVFQAYNLLPRLNALDNVILPIIYDPVNTENNAERMERGMVALKRVGLGDRSHHLPSELSGGQQQRVAIARALINNPVMILADEPTGNLDSRSSEEILDLLHELNTNGSTIVMVTHEPDIAEHTKRVIHFRDGLIETDRQNGHHYSGGQA